MIFLCETKQVTGFVEKACEKLHFDERWVVSKPNGRK